VKKQNMEALGAVKNEYALVLEDKKAELANEAERLKATLSVEAETYRLAAQKRFQVLLDLWETSESLFTETDFSEVTEIKKGVEKLVSVVANLNRYSVVCSQSITAAVENYLQKMLSVLTTSEEKVQKGGITAKGITELLNMIANLTIPVSEQVGMLARIGAKLVPSVGKYLEERRYEVALKAREDLQTTLREEFGVWVTENRALSKTLL